MRKIFFSILLISFVLLIPHQTNSDSPYMGLPLTIPEQQWKPLERTFNADFQQRLENKIAQNPLWRTLVSNHKMAVGLVDLSNPLDPKFARVNGDRMMYAASLPKIAVLLAACQSMEEGILKETPAIFEDLVNMIRYSSNEAATRLIDFLGFKKIETVLRSPKYKLYDPKNGGGLWVGKRYAKSGERHPDPMEGLSHAATVDQVCRFYYLLATGRLVNPERSREMLEIMSEPGLHHKFVHALDSLAPNARVFRKSGTWRAWHSDSALVWEEGKRQYILVAIIEDGEGGKILQELVPVAEEALAHHNLLTHNP
ncbi:MAG: serine hydrolase [Calditrichaceae bacterium]|nr:class A beta-lactamase-related serine hydrolase [Calditrichia bacterium]NUQ42506.1 serine hydrolase [Calditrichaceae bacterium]